ncbi:hypothetical protein [Demequina gelatinilytica]|uniref:hypothetical protein n=1 Tax=Demequina gelatinilytica TaxID=1638980 RepID=UPI000780AC6F|nr:hypothetical protein [Demequina gelatinilytica]
MTNWMRAHPTAFALLFAASLAAIANAVVWVTEWSLLYTLVGTQVAGCSILFVGLAWRLRIRRRAAADRQPAAHSAGPG